MNLIYLKYALEVEKTGSINRAAENLYMNQPNLSRAIRALESSIGIEIFKRTAGGITVTDRGAEFLSRARRIVAEVDDLESRYSGAKSETERLNVAAPYLSPAKSAFFGIASELSDKSTCKLSYRECDSRAALDLVGAGEISIATVRIVRDRYTEFFALASERGIYCEEIGHSGVFVTASRESGIFSTQRISEQSLSNFVRAGISREDDEYIANTTLIRRIKLHDSQSLLDLLESRPDTYRIGGEVPEEELGKYSLRSEKIKFGEAKFFDLLIFKKNYRFSEIESAMIDNLYKAYRGSSK